MSNELKPYISTIEASKIVGCSRNHLITKFESKDLRGKWVFVGARKVRRFLAEDVLKYAEIAKDNKRIGRELYSRDYKRKPTVIKGYRMIYRPYHHRASHDGYVPEHVLVMEEYLGRPLDADEQVHHIDRNKLNNDIDNLVLYGSRADHMRMHAKLRGIFLRIQKDPKLEQKLIDYASKLLKD